MNEITLYELAPTRSARCRWTLLEAGLEYQSAGNTADIIGSDELKALHPLGKLPAAVINGRALFESAAICTAIADLVPEKNLIDASGTWERALHDQWVSFALTEMEAWAWSAELNTMDFVIPKDQHVPDIIEQCQMLFARSAAVLDRALADQEYLVADRFTVTDIIVGFAVNFGDELGWIKECANLRAYLDRLFEREHCTLVDFR